MIQKLAIAVSGAVSLGSYEAGVMYEIIEAIAQHNQSSKTTEDQKIEIDVITGASAGAMTACILAQKLLFEADKLRQPFDNDLYKSWIKDVDIKKLLQSRPGDNPDKAILSSGLVEEIATKYLLQRYESGPPRSRNRHPAAADTIRLGIAMSNLNGYDFKVKMSDFREPSNTFDSEDNSFTLTRHQDCYVTQIQGTEADDQHELWNLIKKVGISSGAFPFAFQVQEILRQTEDQVYKDSEIYKKGLVEFAYTDGGVFENEPLGIAKKLVNQLDTNPRDYERRFYLYVAPGPKSSIVNKRFNEDEANYVNTAKALAGAISTQARFQDWITTSDINEAIRRLDMQAVGLKKFLQEHPDKKSEFDIVAKELLKSLYASENAQAAVNNSLEDYKRLKEQFAEEYEQLANLGENGDEIASTWLKAVQALEKAAGLGSKEVMKIYAITSKDEELASEKLSAFGGFFDEQFREYDYFIGRNKAINFLQDLRQKNQQEQKNNHLYLMNFELRTDLRQPQINLGSVELDRVDKTLRKEVRNLLLDRMSRIIDSLEKRWWFTWLLKFSARLFIEKKLNKLLKLE